MTTTDLDTRGQQNGIAMVAPTPPEAISAAIEQWVGGLAASVQGAEYIVDTPLCPDSLWPLPPGTTLSKIPGKNPKVPLPGEDRESYLARRRVAAYSLGGIVRFGLQLGIPPEVAPQGLFPIGGRISMYADQMVALVKSRGHKHRIIERTAERCTIEVHRLGDREPQRFTYTIEDAIQNGYVPGKGPNANLGTWPDGKPKEGGNPKYITDAPGMLEARCNSTGLTAVFPDVLRGLVTYEEVQDERRAERVEVTAEVVEPAPRASAAAILAQAPAPALPEPVEQAPAPAVQPEPAPVERYILPASKQQLDLLKARFEQLGIGGRTNAMRESRMRVLSELTARDITDPRQLTNDEAKLCIDNLIGDNGLRVCQDIGVLPDDPQADVGEPKDAPASDPAGDYDPTTSQDWPGDTP